MGALNIVVTVLVLAVGLSLVFSIFYREMSSRTGVVLVKRSLQLRFPVSKSIELKPEQSGSPKRLILRFPRSVGFYNGRILLKCEGVEVGGDCLPVRPERTGMLKFYN